MGSNYKITGPGCKILQCVCGLLTGRKAAQNLNIHRKTEKPLQSRLIVLLSQDRRRAEESRLLPVQNALHDRTEGNFRFTKSDVSAKEPVHRDRRFHILFDLRGTAELVIRLRIGEILLKFTLPLAVRSKCITGCLQPFGIEADQAFGHIFCSPFCSGAPFFPLNTAHFGEPDICIFRDCGIF